MFESMTRRNLLKTTAVAGLAAMAHRAGAAGAAETAAAKAPGRDVAPWSLYAFDNGLNGPDVPEVEAKAALLKKLGYAGMTDHYNLNRLPQVLAALDKHGLEFASLYVTPLIENEIDPKLADAVAILKGRRSRIEINFNSKKFKPSDPAGDPAALDYLKRVADWCGDTGPLVTIYPHRGCWTERHEDALRLVKAVARPTVGMNLNLVHWKWVKPVTPLADLLAQTAPHLSLVTINGLGPADEILPLGEGPFDVTAWLAAVKKAGFNGPVGLQCYKVAGPSEAHLAKSMAAWKEMKKAVNP